MSENHRDFIKSKGLTYTTASRGVQKKMTEYNQLETEIEKLKAKDLSNASEALKKQTQEQIADAEQALSEINDEVIKSYNKWEKDKGNYSLRIQQMNDAKAKKKLEKGGQAPPAQPAVVVPAASTDPAPAQTPTPAPAQTPAASTEPAAADKKDGIGWGWVLGTAAAVAGLFFGIRAFNNK